MLGSTLPNEREAVKAVIRFLKRWLRVERPSGVWLNPSTTIAVDAPIDDVFARALRGIEWTLGGHIRAADRDAGTIEASFGLVNSERLTCTLEADGATTRVRITSRRGPDAEQRRRSDYVEALAAYLASPPER